jgi:hypothetical protein
LATDNTSFQRGYSAAFFAPFRYAMWLSITTFILFVTAWVVQYWVVHQVWDHDTTRLHQLLILESEQTLAPLGVESVRQRGADLALWLHKWLFQITGIDQYFARESLPAASATMVERFFGAILPGIEVASTSTKLIGVRIMALAASAPVILLAFGLGMTVGLAERVIRREEGGRESSTRYHHSKYNLALFSGFMTIGYIASPVYIPLQPLVLGVALLAFLLARMQFAYLKKYL